MTSGSWPWTDPWTRLRQRNDTHDQVGRPVRSELASSLGGPTAVTTTAYDQRGLVVSATSPNGNAAGADPAKYTTTNGLGRPVKTTARLGESVSTVNDSLGNAMQVAEADSASAVLRTRTSTYDREGRVCMATSPATGAVTFPLLLSRITQSTGSPSRPLQRSRRRC
ncbi:hypothetical protein [Kitasatospora fiedleri]|uniref:hypothetical protein n=1 Tax=Kitasatospora fiedleri TaxID=2991545 RepID=UPI00249AA3B9|nr:hypothetical protein [Kitasatospora fiedleri]